MIDKLKDKQVEAPVSPSAAGPGDARKVRGVPSGILHHGHDEPG